MNDYNYDTDVCVMYAPPAASGYGSWTDHLYVGPSSPGSAKSTAQVRRVLRDKIRSAPSHDFSRSAVMISDRRTKDREWLRGEAEKVLKTHAPELTLRWVWVVSKKDIIRNFEKVMNKQAFKRLIQKMTEQYLAQYIEREGLEMGTPGTATSSIPSIVGMERYVDEDELMKALSEIEATMSAKTQQNDSTY